MCTVGVPQQLPNGVIISNGIEIEDSGDVVRFTRGVVLNLDGEEPGAKP